MSESMNLMFFSWLRFCLHDGDMMILVQSKLHDESRSEDVSIKWRAENVSAFSAENESKVLAWINTESKKALNEYPQSLKEDLEIIEKDDHASYLTFNQRNCVLFRIGEKEILHWLIDFSEYALKLLSMK